MKKEYKPGDAVYVLNRKQVDGVPKKLLPVWVGPAMILKKYSSFVYKIRLYYKIKVVNHDSLKPCPGKVPKWILRARADPTKFVEPKGKEGPYCLCNGPIDEVDTDNWMIQCEYCDKWFHAKCIGLTRSQEERLPVYQCRDCEGEDEIFRISYNDRYQTQDADPPPGSSAASAVGL